MIDGKEYKGMKNVIISGATSFIGVQLIQELLINGYYITAIVRHDSANRVRLPKVERLKIIELEMEKYHLLSNILCDKQYDIFYHLAWEGTRDPQRNNEQLQLKNYLNSVIAMEVASKLKCKVFVGCGSQAEYGRCEGRITEERFPNPISEYGKAKLKTNIALTDLSGKYDIKFIWARIFSVYGKYDNKDTLIMSSLQSFLRNSELNLTKCMQMWDFIHVEDAARAIYLLSTQKCETGTYHIASGISKPLKEFVLEMKKVTGSRSTLNFGAIPYGPDGAVSFEPVIDKLKNNLNWSCRVSFEDGISNLYQYLKGI
jgi:nucleoside-diphosphate-sugar epimerase